jgi:hypothetical protein
MPWSFPGIVYPVELIYTQSLGFQPDVLLIRSLPQLTNIPVLGTATLSWGATTVTLPNVTVDLGSVNLSTDGRFLLFKAFDRRKRWERAAPISGEYNSVRANAYVTARQRSLRQLGVLLMTALGESSYDVSVLPTNVYPAVTWECTPVVEAAQLLLEEYGYSIALGYGSEQVTVVQVGVGATLPTTNRFIGSDTMDPETNPQYVQNCFAPSAAQVRLELTPVGLDTDDSWVPIDSLSYAPGGSWASVAPYSLPGIANLEANGFVRRAYQVTAFADGTLNLPDGSGTLNDITDILPIDARLIESEDLRFDGSLQPFRVYGRYFKEEDETGNPVTPGGLITAIGDEVVGRRMRFYGETGLLVFEEPIWYSSGGSYYPADLYLEATIGVRHPTNFSWQHYEYPVSVDPSGYGYITVKHPDLRAQTVVSYNSSHAVTGTTTNQTALNAVGASWAAAIAASMGTKTSQHVVYYEPKLTLRCDGAIRQVQHILTCGELGHAVNRTTASSHFEFDRGTTRKSERIAHLRALASGVELAAQKRIMSIRKAADD